MSFKYWSFFNKLKFHRQRTTKKLLNKISSYQQSMNAQQMWHEAPGSWHSFPLPLRALPTKKIKPLIIKYIFGEFRLENIYLWRKVVCFVVMRSAELGCFRSCSWCLWKALDEEEGCMGLVPWHLDLRCKSSWILNDFFTEN